MVGIGFSYSNVLKNIGIREMIQQRREDGVENGILTVMKSYRQLERIMKGVANHRRIEILDLLYREPQLSVMEISEKLGVNFKTISEHVRRLAHAGLVLKRSEGAAVRHALVPQGTLILKFLRTLE